MEQVFIIIPSAIPDGPMKGAVALCNGMVGRCMVHLVSINRGDRSIDSELDKEVDRIRLEELGGWPAKVKALRSKVRDAGGSGPVTLISYSLKADIMSLAVREEVRRISRVSANLMKNYKYDYGSKGAAAAIAHYQLMRLFDVVVTMSDAMTDQLRRYGVTKIVKIENFIDEINMEVPSASGSDRGDCVRFLFLGSLTERKRPDLAFRAVIESNRKGAKCSLDVIGDGPLRGSLERLVEKNKADSFIHMHGYIGRPFAMFTDCDYMVLPSESEGTARAVMEALYYGVPCIMRDIDGNREIIRHDINGYLFQNDDEFLELVLAKAGNGAKRSGDLTCLLPDEYRQSTCIDKYLKLLG